MARNYAAWLESTRLLAACKDTRNYGPVKMDLNKSKTCRRGVNATSGYLFLRAVSGTQAGGRLGTQKQGGIETLAHGSLISSSARRDQ